MSRRSLEDQVTKRHSGRKTRKVENEADLDAATLAWKKSYAVFLKASDHSYRYMSTVLGVTSRMVKGWFEDAEMQERVLKVQSDMLEGAMTLLQRYGVEAVEILMQNARKAQSAGAWAESTRAATEALDRMGITKVNKSESHIVRKSEQTMGLDETVLDQFEALPLETQHKLAALSAEMQAELEGAKGKE